MSLEKSTPYRNAWYRDLLEKEAELKQYTDEKVAQAIELPEVTSEDNGDLLAADDGSWTKSDKLKTIMNAGAEQVGKIPMVGVTGSWELTDYPSNELPSVTSADNGKVAGVVDGNWDTMDIPNELPTVTGADDGKVLGVTSGAWGAVTPSSKGLVIFKINNSNILLDNKHFSDVKAAILEGNDVALQQGEYLLRLVYTPNNTYTGAYFVRLRFLDNNIAVTGLYANLDSIGNEFNATTIFRCVPPTPIGNTRKLLTAIGATFEYIDPELSLKSVQFVNGQALSNADYASIKANTNVRGIYSDASKYIIFELSSCNFAQTEFEFVNYKEGLKATIGTDKVVTITQIPVNTGIGVPYFSNAITNSFSGEGSLS